jgi:hypothetical protein
MRYCTAQIVPLVIPANAGIHVDFDSARKARSNRKSTMDSGVRRNDGSSAADGAVGEAH